MGLGGPELAILSFAAGGLNAFGQFQAGAEQERIENFNASIAEQEARNVRASEVLNQFQKKKQIAQIMGSQRAAFAKAGVSYTGSPIVLAHESLTNAEMDLSISKHNAELKAQRLESEARIRGFRAKAAKRAGTRRAITTLLSAGVKAGTKFKDIPTDKIGQATGD